MNTELLAPAGSLETLKAVIHAGADAVYIGGTKFGARAYADNPGKDDLIEGLDFAHLRGKKVYLTVNTLLKNTELNELYDYILPYYEHGLDAVLVQDFGVLKYLHEQFPDLELHASTQMTVTGALAAEDLKQYGVTRVVPARELSLSELREIREQTHLEVEVFIHGALCVCYSGQCLYSSMIGGRSGNRGRCAQPCRLLYLMDDQTGYNGKQSILERPEARHFLSPKDLNGINMIGSLVKAGMDSLKIEGRMKRPEYAAGVVSIYRKYLDMALSGHPQNVSREDAQALYDLYNRTGFTDGYFHRKNGPDMMAPVKHELTPAETRARHDLYDRMHDAYLLRNTKVPITAYVSVYSGQPLALTLLSGEETVSVTGTAAEPASSRPLSLQRIEEQIRKVGDSDFSMEELYVDTDETSFVPVRALNELRRAGIEALRHRLLEAYQRTAPNRGIDRSIPEPENREAKMPGITVLVSTKEQFDAALHEDGIREIYLESSALYGANVSPVECAKQYLIRSLDNQKAFSIAMPYIDRNGSSETALKTAAGELSELGLCHLLVRNYETLAWSVEAGLSHLICADAGLYTYNRLSQAFIEEHGACRQTAPVELNRKELLHRDNHNSEIIAYGRIPLMITAQCLEKNNHSCTKRNAEHVLTDRMGVSFPTRCVCPYCYNIIYNSVPLSLLTEFDTLKKLGFSDIRLQFTTETAAETAGIIRLAVHNLQAGRTDDIDGDHTKGHFLRGVE